jgi:hypothetical protein
MKNKNRSILIPLRHPELDSGSILAISPRSPKWMLNQVQHDGLGSFSEASPTQHKRGMRWTGAGHGAAGGAHPLDREMRLAGVNWPEDCPDRGIKMARHCTYGCDSLSAENKGKSVRFKGF